MSAVYLEPWQQQAIELNTILTAATATGGALAGYDVERVAPPESTLPQTLGWQFRRHADQLVGQNLRRQTAVFELMLVTWQGSSNVNTDAANQARIAAETAWNDGAGNGLGAVLRGDPSLGGTCTNSTSSLAISVGRSVTEETDISSVLIVTLTTVADAPIFY